MRFSIPSRLKSCFCLIILSLRYNMSGVVIERGIKFQLEGNLINYRVQRESY